MSQGWIESVQANRETLQEWADSDLPLADEMAQLIEQADRKNEN